MFLAHGSKWDAVRQHSWTASHLPNNILLLLLLSCFSRVRLYATP